MQSCAASLAATADLLFSFYKPESLGLCVGWSLGLMEVEEMLMGKKLHCKEDRELSNDRYEKICVKLFKEMTSGSVCVKQLREISVSWSSPLISLKNK